MSLNVLHASPSFWIRTFKRQELARAYFHVGESEWEKLKQFFSDGGVDEPGQHQEVDIINLSDGTQTYVFEINLRGLGTIVILDDDEDDVISPAVNNHRNSRMRLFDEPSDNTLGEEPIDVTSLQQYNSSPEWTNRVIARPSTEALPGASSSVRPSTSSVDSCSPMKWFWFANRNNR